MKSLNNNRIVDDDVIDATTIFSIYTDVTSKLDLVDKALKHEVVNILEAADGETQVVNYKEFTLVDLNNQFINLVTDISNVLMKHYNISGWVNKVKCLRFLIENYIQIVPLNKYNGKLNGYPITNTELMIKAIINNFESTCVETFTGEHKYNTVRALDKDLKRRLKSTVESFINELNISVELCKLVENLYVPNAVCLLIKVDVNENTMFMANKVKLLFAYITNK